MMNLIKDVCSKQLTIQKGKDKLLEEIYKLYFEFRELEELEKLSDQQLL
jgi:hypothetical protein